MGTPPTATRIDLNSDLGEGFGHWTLGDDEAMLQVVSSASIACGFHAGDPRIMAATCRVAAQRGVAVGAHVSYRDLAGFGRRAMAVASADLVPEIGYQIGALQALAQVAGTAVGYVKPHGALYNRIIIDEGQAADVVRAVGEVDPQLVILGPPGSVILQIAQAQGLPTAREVFADRAYHRDATLVPREIPGSVLVDPQLVAERMLSLITDGEIEAIDGSTVRLAADSICVHSDSPGAVELASAVRCTLVAAGISIMPFTGTPRP